MLLTAEGGKKTSGSLFCCHNADVPVQNAVDRVVGPLLGKTVSRDEVLHHCGTGDIATNLRLVDGRVEIRETNMKADVVRLAAVILVATASAADAASETIIVNSIDANGVGKKVGTLDLSDTTAGLRVTPRLTDLPPGDHGFHVHVNPDCGPGGVPNGQPAAGMAAGGHYDLANTGKHLGPQGRGAIRAT